MQKLGWHTLGTAFDCPCGERHELPIEACHTGPDAAEKLASFARERCGARALVIADENTRQAAGEKPFSKLSAAGKKITEKMYPGGELEATQEKAEEVAAAGRDCDFYAAIGGGTLSDLAKSAGDAQQKPVLLYPTAASMNGYTSAIVALKIRGLKRTVPCQPALGIFCDPEVAATAPQRMTAAGAADFLSKCSSSSDWRAAHILRGDYYCHRPREFNEGIQERLFAAAPAAGRAEPEAIAVVLEALLLSGFGMVIAGSSAPASGGEHLISHYLDMKHALYGTQNDLHGTQVGVATIHMLGLWQRVLAMDPADIDVDALIEAQPAEEAIRTSILEDWGESVGAEVQAQWDEKKLDTAALRREIKLFCEKLPELREKLALDLAAPGAAAQCIADCGGPVRPEALHAPLAEYNRALRNARYLRNRFTILDLAAELGVA
jgi:glycerol-1-phosphate dehydrogenase [NAD(P)+]